MVLLQENLLSQREQIPSCRCTITDSGGGGYYSQCSESKRNEDYFYRFHSVLCPNMISKYVSAVINDSKSNVVTL